MFGIFYKNLILTILTLGIYRFWAKTRERRFIWANTHIDGEGFEYTGTGKELFLGFLKAVVVLVPLFAALEVIDIFVLDESMIGTAILGAVRVVLILGLVYAGTFAARKYRMSRTTWRGIRLHQAGSIWTYAGTALLGMLLVVLTLGLYLPFLQVRLMRYELGNLRFGSAPFRFTGEGKDLLRRFRRVWIALAIVVAGPGAGTFVFGNPMAFTDPAAPSTAGRWSLCSAFCRCSDPFGRAAFPLVPGQGLSLPGGARFHSTGLAFAMPNLTGWRIFRLMVGN